MHPHLNHRTLHQRLPIMNEQRLLQRDPHLQPTPLQHLIIILLNRLLQRLLSTLHFQQGRHIIRTILQRIVKALATVRRHGVRRVAAERHAACAVVPFGHLLPVCALVQRDLGRRVDGSSDGLPGLGPLF